MFLHMDLGDTILPIMAVHVCARPAHAWLSFQDGQALGWRGLRVEAGLGQRGCRWGVGRAVRAEWAVVGGPGVSWQRLGQTQVRGQQIGSLQVH